MTSSISDGLLGAKISPAHAERFGMSGQRRFRCYLPRVSFYEFQMRGIEGDPLDFATFRDRVCLIVNVASR